MSLGLEVSLHTTSGKEGAALLRPAKGRDSLGDLFMSLMAVAMGQGNVIPGTVTGTPEADLGGEVPGMETVAAPAHVDGAPAGITAPVSDTAISSTEAASTCDTDWVPASAVSGEIRPAATPADKPFESLSAEPGVRLSGDFARVGGLRAAAQDSPEPAEDFTARAVTAGVQPGARVSRLDGPREILGAMSDGRPSGTEEIHSGEAGVSLPDAIAAGEDVIPKVNVDAKAVHMKASEVLKQAKRLLLEDTATGPERSEEMPGQGDLVSGSELSAAPKKDGAEVDRASVVSEARDTEVSVDDATPERETEAVEALPEGVRFERAAPEVAPTAIAAARPEKGDRNTAVPAISLDNVRDMAEKLREEALKRLPRSVEFRLDPPELGSVTVLLSTRGQDVAVKFIAASGEAHRPFPRHRSTCLLLCRNTDSL